VLGLANPRVGILSNGEEEGKGNEQVRAAAPLLHQAEINFVGNVEPKEVLQGAVDVMVCDGFVGNIFIKTMEAFGSTLFNMIRSELKYDLRSKIGGALVRPAMRRLYRQVDPFEIGGAPLLGVNGVVIIGHGRTNALGVKNAIRQARQAVNGKIMDALRTRFQKENVLEEVE
jgi:glycerol-3-phosphate acyltransferase PlsX